MGFESSWSSAERILAGSEPLDGKRSLCVRDEGVMMNSEADPIVGNWYQHLDKGQAFQVVYVDEESDLVEIQYFDGDVEGMDFDTWHRLDIEPIEAPENWSGPLDVSELDDLTGTEVSDTPPEDWAEPLEEIQKPEEQPVEEIPEEPENDWGGAFPEEEPLDEEPPAEMPEELDEEELRQENGDF